MKRKYLVSYDIKMDNRIHEEYMMVEAPNGRAAREVAERQHYGKYANAYRMPHMFHISVKWMKEETDNAGV